MPQPGPFEYPPLENMPYQPFEFPALDDHRNPFQARYSEVGSMPPPPPRRNSAGPVLGVVGVVLVLAAVVAAGLFAPSSSDDTRDTPSTRMAISVPRTTSPPPGTITMPPRSPATTVAVLPGYQGVEVASRGVAYDVPAEWTVDKPGIIRGFEGDSGRMSGTGTTVDGKDYCESSTRTVTFVHRSSQSDPAVAAVEVARRVAELGFDGPEWGRRTSPAAPVTTLSGITGQMSETSGTWTPKSAECASTRFSVYTFAFPGPEHPMLVLTIAADREVDGEVTPELAREIFSSVRLIE
ncbi:hypothetical protein [Nocardia otitidiscaviarum]|uniref:hypothetical protein n=1 Tax=Nocardia otitidiscaviarum TaxID=1823 RepID=UPI0018956A99|nr:hypothetical protein [Nocardia otitidiscaviarum]MBF6235829.1 hypothetical protein [Nocardia otitidiscaviarum]